MKFSLCAIGDTSSLLRVRVCAELADIGEAGLPTTDADDAEQVLEMMARSRSGNN